MECAKRSGLGSRVWMERGGWEVDINYRIQAPITLRQGIRLYQIATEKKARPSNHAAYILRVQVFMISYT